jgi:gliding motility-associatede transport system auxiliary component
MKTVFKIFQDKQIRYGGYAALITIILLASLVALNLLVQQLPARLDLTENKLFSLSDQTDDLIQGLENPVKIYALYAAGKEEPNVAEILRKYEQASRLISVEFVDPDLNPGFVTGYDDTGEGIAPGSLIIESGDLYRVIPHIELYNISYSQQGQPQLMGMQVEPKVSQAIHYVSSGYTPKVYQLTGHGEFSLDDYGISPALEAENYEIETLNLLTREFPEDASVLLILSPRYDIPQEEQRKIHDYIDSGGRALLLADFIGPPSNELNNLLRSYGLEIEPGFIMENDKNRYTGGSPLFIAPRMLEHEILEPLKENNLSVITPNAVEITELERKPGTIELTPLLASTEQSWRRTDIQNSSPLKQPGDVAGPHTIAWAVERQQYNDSDPESFRLVVMGNSIFLGSIPPYGQIKGNVDYFLNALAWVNERSESINIRSKSLFRVPMRLSTMQIIIYSGILIILIPAAFLLAGLTVWLRRRHL